MKAIVEESRALAWLAAAKYLSSLDDWEGYSLVLEVADPMRRNAADQRIESVVDAFLLARNCSPLTTVSETIFPGGEYRRHGPKGVYEIYPKEVYPKIKPLPELQWGTYAHRLVCRRRGKEVINPLEYCVDKIKGQLSGSMSTACYELSLWDLEGDGIGEVDGDVALYDPHADRKRFMSGPCLSHVSLKVTRDRRVLLTALYRSHYYVQKALGNLLGLSRLQAFVCEQTQLMPGPLVCVSTFAKLERVKGWRKADVLSLIAEAEGAVHSVA